MNILNINSYYYSSSVHRELQNKLKEKGVIVETFAPVVYGHKPRKECESIDENAVKRIECFSSIDRLFFFKKHKMIIDMIMSLYDFEKINIIHAHSLFSNGYVAMKIKEKFDLPYAVAVRDTDVNVFFKKAAPLRIIGQRILYNASQIIFLSNSYKEAVINSYVPDKHREMISKKSCVIPNGIDTHWIENTAHAKKNNFNKNISIIHVGPLSKRKNILTTVKACEILISRGYDICLNAVGTASDSRIYDKFRSKKFTCYHGHKSKEELQIEYKNNHILVVPSITETFGLVYPEAMSQGLPVIYTRYQGFDGYFDEGDVGYSVNPKDPVEIADKIEMILDDYEKISVRCVCNVKQFDWRRIVDSYINLYKELLQ